MFHKPTVLVLGAGASIPYHYPSGPDLVSQIARLEERPEWMEQRKKIGYSDELFADLTKRLRQSDKTIDEFLRWNPNLQQVGKLAIAQRLFYVERHTDVFSPKYDEGHWYDLLAALIAPSTPLVAYNKLTILTFNYDRSLDHYLHSNLRATFNLSDEETEVLLRPIKIIHLHGILNELPWRTNSHPHSYGYGAELGEIHGWKAHHQASEKIRTIHELNETEDVFHYARQLLRMAEYVFFLGLDYHDDNMKRLGFPIEGNQKATLAGTCYKMTPRKKQETAAKYKVGLFNGHIREFINSNEAFTAATTPEPERPMV